MRWLLIYYVVGEILPTSSAHFQTSVSWSNTIYYFALPILLNLQVKMVQMPKTLYYCILYISSLDINTSTETDVKLIYCAELRYYFHT